MNIALFSDSYLPTKSGIVTVVIQLRSALEALGHHVVIVTVETTAQSQKDTEEDQNIFRVSSIPLGLGTDQFVGFPHKKKIIRFLQDHNIELIHSHTEFHIAHAAKTVGKDMHIPVIATTHTMWEDFYDYYLPMGKLIPINTIRKVVQRLFRKFYAVINVSSKARDYFKQDFMLPKMPSAIIPNAIDTEAFHRVSDTPDQLKTMRENWGISASDIVLLFVGRIGEEKRVLELLDVCISVVNQRPDVKALFIGNGPALEQMQKKTQQERVDHRIIFTGFVNWTDLHTYYSLSDIFMTCSLSEMHSMTVLEALLSGLPLVTRSDSSYFDTVYPNQNGYLAETDAEVEQNLIQLIDDAGKRKAFGKKSLEISSHFSLETHAKKTVAFYQVVLDAYPRPLDEQVLRRAVESI